MSAVQVTAAGTYATANLTDRNMIGTVLCTGFVVGHKRTDAAPVPLVIAL